MVLKTSTKTPAKTSAKAPAKIKRGNVKAGCNNGDMRGMGGVADASLNCIKEKVCKKNSLKRVNVGVVYDTRNDTSKLLCEELCAKNTFHVGDACVTFCDVTDISHSSADSVCDFNSTLGTEREFEHLPCSPDVIVMIGGDGLALHVVHRFMHLGIPFYGINRGNVGFLMNTHSRAEEVAESIIYARQFDIHPLKIELHTNEKVCGISASAHSKKCFKLPKFAINEISCIRSGGQAAKLEVSINGVVQMECLTADGIIVSTPIGSTGYNFSVHGSILPLNSNLISIMPVSPFRPRHWRGALVSDSSSVGVSFIEFVKRPVTVYIDFERVEGVSSFSASVDKETTITLLFDQKTTIEERMIKEQFGSY